MCLYVSGFRKKNTPKCIIGALNYTFKDLSLGFSCHGFLSVFFCWNTGYFTTLLEAAQIKI